MEKRRVTIVSDGNGSITAAADLLFQGHDILLYNLKEKEERMSYLDKEMTFYEDGKEPRKIKIPYTTDPKKAAEHAEIIMYIMPGYAIPVFAKELAPFTKEDTILFFNAAASLAPLIYAKATETNPKYSIESHTLTYATRVDKEKNEIHLLLRVKEVFAAASNPQYTDKLVKELNTLYPLIEPANDLIHVFLLNANPETHTAGCILNAGRIEYSQGEFYLYKEGITKSTLKVMRKVAKERRKIADAFGYDLKDEIESRLDNGYFVDTDKEFNDENERLQHLFNYSPVFRDIKGPTNVGSRYFLEDIAIGLVHWEKLGKAVNVDTPTITSLIQIGEAIEGRDYRDLGSELIPWDLVQKYI